MDPGHLQWGADSVSRWTGTQFGKGGKKHGDTILAVERGSQKMVLDG
jgi:hypothetical protein